MVWGKLPENLDWFSGFVHTSIVDLLGKAISFRALISQYQNNLRCQTFMIHEADNH